jgi:hypothetical protein
MDELKLGEEIRRRVDGALASGHPILLAAVDAQGRPRLSFRGSLQAFSDDQLGFWARNPEGATLDAIRANPNVALIYRAPADRVILQFTGRARIAADPDERARVYASAPDVEQRADPEMKGLGVIIDLDAVEGILGLDAQGQRRRVSLARAG